MQYDSKILIPLYGNDVSPRFDLATEILITSTETPIGSGKERIIVLPQASAEKLCHLVLTEGVQAVICGGIEEEYYHYLIWKKVTVVDSVIGSWELALHHFVDGKLYSGTLLPLCGS